MAQVITIWNNRRRRETSEDQKKDPLGGEIRPFNDEYKQDDGKNMLNSHGRNGMSGSNMQYQGGMNKFSPVPEEEQEHGEGGVEMEQQELRHGKGHNNVEDSKGEADGNGRLVHTKNTVARHKQLKKKNFN